MYDIIWVCDRESNLKKALEKYTVVHCVAHRLNKVLQQTFYQAEMNKVKNDVTFGDNYIDSAEDEDDQMSESESEEIEESFDDEELIDKQTKAFNVSKISSSINPSATLSQLSADAKRVLVTIIHCKQLVKYIKKVNLNQELEDRDARVLIQSTIVRWLSLYYCLESVRQFLNLLSEIFDEKKWIKNEST
ncbi:unnamed protein product [Rotaria socialis]|uniref:Uncharacterized protein n=1 Tax=Rotaria socialis TaxID=392032 RepID=A0A820YT11_9BILA|nr:unnamed protein product [Rotaria socialis]CAF3608092.1 unnamed protein product [Rotaria socialis]CAF3676474.1 unnamed protein product [Rotaria socialis]CAF3770308.1 unnamed protein product [Rotaria socialis]CAF4554674.1 unnamed protein product [Rotaria socialis]